MKPHIGLTDVQRRNVAIILSKILADEYILLVKTKKYHWNVQGRQFNDLHKFFDEQHKQLTVITDDVAERIRALGNATPATLVEFQKLTRLKEEQAIYPNDKKMIENLLSDNETIIRTLRTELETCNTIDAGTTDVLTGLMIKHEKMAWMLRSFLEE